MAATEIVTTPVVLQSDNGHTHAPGDVLAVLRKQAAQLVPGPRRVGVKPGRVLASVAGVPLLQGWGGR